MNSATPPKRHVIRVETRHYAEAIALIEPMARAWAASRHDKPWAPTVAEVLRRAMDLGLHEIRASLAAEYPEGGL